MVAIDEFEKEGHTVFRGDALIVLDTHIADQSVDLVFADPPYNIGKHFGDFHDKWRSDDEYVSWCYQWLDLCIRKLKPTGSMYLMASTQAMPYFDLYLRKKMTILSRIVWHYDSSGVQARKYYGSLHEPILYCVKDAKNYIFNAEDILVEARTGAVRKLVDYRKTVPSEYSSKKIPGNAWYFPRVRFRMPEYEDHPSQKPEALLERIILASTKKEGVVLDPFSGTFTTGSVAKRLGRNSISIEISEAYVKAGLRRLGILPEGEGDVSTQVVKEYKRRDVKPRINSTVAQSGGSQTCLDILSQT